MSPEIPIMVQTLDSTAAGYVATAWPPCGTDEAKTARACIQWRTVPCPSEVVEEYWGNGKFAFHAAAPIGCDPPHVVIRHDLEKKSTQ